MHATISRERFGFGSVLWAGLAAYVLGVDIYALSTGRETLTEAFGRALVHPKRRWLVSVSWALTTKHLFFKRFLPWLDPFALIGLSLAGMNKLIRRV